jgi:phage gpG-like protein
MGLAAPGENTNYHEYVEMDDDGITLDLTAIKEIERFLRKVGREVSNVDKPLRHWGAYQLQETGRTFDRGGRGPVEWKPLSEMTLALRKLRGRGANPKRILQVSGHLKRGVQTNTITKGGVRSQHLINRVPYAADHQYGATKTRPQQVIRPKKKKALHFFLNGEEVFAKKVVQPARDYQIPQRKFLFILPKDVDKAIELLGEHATAIAKRAARGKKPGG